MNTERVSGKLPPQTAAGDYRTQEKTPNLKAPEIWVKKWVDYSSKYGLGYLLNNGATGVFFNDSTKIVLDPAGHHFDYYERRASDRQDVGTECTLIAYPKDLQKKVTLLQHFRSYLEGSDKPKGEDQKQEEEPPAPASHRVANRLR